MSVECFIDTNLFIYQLEALDARKSAVADSIISKGLSTQNACISVQVVSECLNTIVRKAEQHLNISDAKRYLDTVLVPLWRIMPDQDLYRQALDLQERYQYGFYDSLIIASATAAGCKTLFSEDMHHGQKIGKLTICNPFLKQ